MISKDAPYLDDEAKAPPFDSTVFDETDYDVDYGYERRPSMTREQLHEHLRGVCLPRSSAKGTLADTHPVLHSHLANMSAVSDRPCLLELFGHDVPSLVDPRLHDWPIWLIKLDDSWAPRITVILEREDVFSYTGQDCTNPWNVAQWLAINAAFPHETDLYAPHLRVKAHHVSTVALYGEVGVIALIECAGLVSWMGLTIDHLLDELQAGGVSSCSDPLFDHTVASLQAQMREASRGGPCEPDGTLTLPALCKPNEDEFRHGERFTNNPSGYLEGQGPRVDDEWAEAAMGLLPTIVDYLPPGLTYGDFPWVRITVDQEFFTLVREAASATNTTVTPCLLRGFDPAIRVSVQRHCYVVDAYFRAQALRLQPALHALVRHGRCQIAFECERSGELHTWEVSWPSNCGPVAPSALPIPMGTQAILDMEMPYDPEQRQRAQDLADTLGRDVSLFSALGKGALTWQLGQLKQRGQGPRGGIVSLIPRFELAS